ncbi:chlorohydrolase [Streptococcus pneumoniae]|nr:chlorohydrolase [Streptococcus pneumoniae]CKC39777.1 chlorohydrolase [Streptococcus pneumoniae]
MKIKGQTRKLAAGCSKHCFEVMDRTDEVSSKHCFEVVDRTDEVSSKHCFEVMDRTDEVSPKHCFEVVDRTDEVSSKHCFEVVDRTVEEIFEYEFIFYLTCPYSRSLSRLRVKQMIRCGHIYRGHHGCKVVARLFLPCVFQVLLRIRPWKFLWYLGQP